MKALWFYLKEKLPRFLFTIFISFGCAADDGVPAKFGDEINVTDIKTFLNTCPENDPLIDEVLHDFEILVDGVPITKFPCTSPTDKMNLSSYNTSFFILQSLRVIKRMDAGELPWTEMTLYDWIKTSIDGINIIEGLNAGGMCCEIKNNKTFVVVKNLDKDPFLSIKKQWIGISSTIDLLVHEVRHLQGPDHSSCCGVPYGCDDTYNLDNLGSYGTQLWLNRQWLANETNIGLGSYSVVERVEIENWFKNAIFQFESRICEENLAN